MGRTYHLIVFDNDCPNLWVRPTVVFGNAFPCLLDGQSGEFPVAALG